MPSDTDTVKARWVGSYPAETPDRTALVPGETVVEVPRHQAEGSSNWEIVDGKGKAKKGADG